MRDSNHNPSIDGMARTPFLLLLLLLGTSASFAYGETFKVNPNGRSMNPYIFNHTLETGMNFPYKDLQVGDVIVFNWLTEKQMAEYKRNISMSNILGLPIPPKPVLYAAHAILFINETNFLTQGTNNKANDGMRSSRDYHYKIVLDDARQEKIRKWAKEVYP